MIRCASRCRRAYAQAFAAGAMLTMLADAMMPEAFEHGGKLVGLLTVMGFLVAAMLSAFPIRDYIHQTGI